MLLQDAPEEFLDPLLNTLMSNPVELPNSHTIIDYITISNFHYFNSERETSNE